MCNGLDCNFSPFPNDPVACAAPSPVIGRLHSSAAGHPHQCPPHQRHHLHHHRPLDGTTLAREWPRTAAIAVHSSARHGSKQHSTLTCLSKIAWTGSQMAAPTIGGPVMPPSPQAAPRARTLLLLTTARQLKVWVGASHMFATTLLNQMA